MSHSGVVNGMWYTLWTVNLFQEEVGRSQSQMFPHLFMVDAFQDKLIFWSSSVNQTFQNHSAYQQQNLDNMKPLVQLHQKENRRGR